MTHPLKRYREENRVGATRLARLAGVTRQTIYCIEDERFQPSLNLVARLIAATGNRLSADDFLPQKEKAA